MKILTHKILLTAIILALLPVSALASDQEMISPYIAFSSYKNSENKTFIRTTLTYSKNRMELPLPGLLVTFASGTSGELFLAESYTDANGVATFLVGDDIKLPFNKDGSRNFFTTFAGNDTIEPASMEISVIPLDLKMNLTLVDTIKTIELTGAALINGDTVPAAGETVLVYVSRMFSLLPVGEAVLDEAGNAVVEFPADLPGDSAGMVTIIARIEESLSYGNIEKVIEKDWGIKTSDTQPVSHRALWTKTPPKWMIFTLSILLAGVWGHYMFAIVSLILIKRNARKKSEAEINNFIK